MTERTQSRADRFVAYLTWTGAAMAMVWFVMSLTYPFGWDQGLFAWVGDAITNGGLPYRDAWDIKGPLLYYVYAGVQWLFGIHLWGIRLFDAALLAITAWVMFQTALPLTDGRLASFAAVLYVLWYASHSYWHTAQPDGWAGMLVLGAMAPLLVDSRSYGFSKMVRAGVCIGLAVLLKPVWIVFIALPLLHLLLTRQSRAISHALAVLAGCIIPVGLLVGWLAWQGVLSDYVDIHLKYSALYAGFAPENRLKGLGEYLLFGRVTAVVLPLSAYGAVVLWRERRRSAVLLVMWWAITIVLVAAQGRFYAYHWLPMLPAVTLLTAIGLYDLLSRATTFAYITCGLVYLICIAPIAFEASRFVAWRLGAIDRQAYYDAYGEPGVQMQAVDWLRTAAPGKIFTFGWLCSVAWLSERDYVSRFGYSLPLMMGEGTDVRSRYRAEALAALDADPPRYIVVGPLSEQILGRRFTIADFPELAELMRTRYQEVSRFGAITIYEIRQ